MRLLLVTIDFPLPQDAGGVVRLLGLAETLARRHDVHLLAREREPIAPELVAELSERLGGAPVETFPAPPPLDGSPPAKVARWARAVARRTPPWVLRARCPALERRAVELAPRFDAALVLDDNAAVYVDPLRRVVPVVLDKQNVKGWSFPRSAPGWGGAATGRMIHGLAARLYRSFEGRSAHRAQLVVVTSDEEVERFRRTYRWRPEAIASAISVPAEAADPRAAGRAVVWVGDHTYAANVRGLLRFLREGWRPLGEGGAVLRVAGRHPPAELLRLAEELPGIEVLGFVEDLDALLSRCAAAVVPLWDGAGIKMKTLALMGAGLPVAATPVGVEGLAVRDGVHARVAATPGGLADALVELLDDRAVAAAVGKRGREFILRNHTWSGLVPRYERLLERAAGRV